MYKEKFFNFHGNYSPTIDFNKKVHLNPKIYKLSKFFPKNHGANQTVRKSRKRSLDSNINSLPKSTNKTSSPNLITSESTKIPHLPKLPQLPEISPKRSYIFHNFKLVQPNLSMDHSENSSFLTKYKNSDQRIINGLQTFQFSGIENFRSNSIIKSTVKLEEEKIKHVVPCVNFEEKSIIKRKIVFSKKNQNANAKDFSCFFDSQEITKAHNTSFSSY